MELTGLEVDPASMCERDNTKNELLRNIRKDTVVTIEAAFCP